MIADAIIERYINEITDAAHKYGKSGLKIYCGLEIDYYRGVENELRRLTSKYKFDFLIGAVHCVFDLGFSMMQEAKELYKEYSVAEVFDEYLNLLRDAANSGYFSTIAHLDYYARYIGQTIGEERRISLEKYLTIFECLKKNNLGIEINTSPYKRGIADFHPTASLLMAALNYGVAISSIGSDAHKPSDLGIGVAEAMDFLEKWRVRAVNPRQI